MGSEWWPHCCKWSIAAWLLPTRAGWHAKRIQGLLDFVEWRIPVSFRSLWEEHWTLHMGKLQAFCHGCKHWEPMQVAGGAYARLQCPSQSQECVSPWTRHNDSQWPYSDRRGTGGEWRGRGTSLNTRPSVPGPLQVMSTQAECGHTPIVFGMFMNKLYICNARLTIECMTLPKPCTD